MYIRTCDGRIFAVRMGNKPKVAEGNYAVASGENLWIHLFLGKQLPNSFLSREEMDICTPHLVLQ